MTSELDASYRLCQQAARDSASSFYYSFFLLPRHKRSAMYALYAFLRRTDDLGDGPAPLDEKRHALRAWRESLHHALHGQFDDPLLPALADTVRAFRIPLAYLEAVIDGVEMDLQPVRYETFDDLAVYCHRVASVVGLACLKIWDCHDPAAEAPARSCGLAFQLTNILRDLKEDAAVGRIYLPREDLRRFGYRPEDLMAGVRDERFCALLQFEIARAERLYAEAAPLADWLAVDDRRVLGSMMGVYRALLDEIKRRAGDVLGDRISLSRWRKMQIAARWLLLPEADAPAAGASAS